VWTPDNPEAFIFAWAVVFVWTGVATLFVDYLGQMMGWWDDS